jgi:hypothetical protein
MLDNRIRYSRVLDKARRRPDVLPIAFRYDTAAIASLVEQRLAERTTLGAHPERSTGGVRDCRHLLQKYGLTDLRPRARGDVQHTNARQLEDP